MADQPLNHNDPSDRLEETLASIQPVSLDVSVGKLMYESGREVGRNEARHERQQKVQRSLLIWRLATAACFAAALFSFFGSGIRDTESNNLASSSAQEPKLDETDIDSSGQENQPTTTVVDHSRPSRSFWNVLGFPTQKRPIAGVRGSTVNPEFAAEIQRYQTPTTSFSNTSQSRAFELMHEYRDSGVF